jgi:hypothetical protein
VAYDLSGQALINLAQTNLRGLANAVTSDQLLSYLNEGKDELWSILKQQNENLFTVSSQSTNSNGAYYFAPLSTTAREYTLPFDVRDILFIEVTSPSGYERVRFTRKSMLSAAFRDARTAANAFNSQGGSSPLSGIGEYFYDIVGKGTFVLAQYPEVAFSLNIWFVRALPDITIGQTTGTIDEILFPFHKKIIDFAVSKIMLREDMEQFTAWREQWKEDIINVVQGVGRKSADPQFVEEFEG